MAQETGRGGSIVAFEGHQETVSTQLRLLPTSPHILILPSIQSYLPDESSIGHNFDPHAYIRRVHDAVVARNEAARQFVQGAPSTCKRLVFMNGGTPSAQALCTRSLVKYETHGDRDEADSIFSHLVKEGIAGLRRQAKHLRAQTKGAISACKEYDKVMEKYDKSRNADQAATGVAFEEDLDEFQDPITRAMRAAEALDRKTASLQPSDELDLTLPPRPRSISLPLYGYSDKFGDATPFFVFGAQSCQQEEGIVEDEDDCNATKPRFSVTHWDALPVDEPVNRGFSDLIVSETPQSPRCMGESYGHVALNSPPRNVSCTSGTDALSPCSPGKVFYGEASVLYMKSSQRRPSLRRARSLDRPYSMPSKEREMVGRPDASGAHSLLSSRTRPQSCMVFPPQKSADSGGVGYVDWPRTITVKPKQKAVVVDPAPAERKRKPARPSYVDKGTDAEAIETPPPSNDGVEIKSSQQLFQPLLCAQEDFVVYFKDDVPDALLDSAVTSFKSGKYPLLAHQAAPFDSEETSNRMPRTPDTRSLDEPQSLRGISEADAAEVFEQAAAADEYDPFAYMQLSRPTSTRKRNTGPVKMQKPPTPQQTPPPSVAEKDGKLQEVKVLSDQTAVALQNELRCVLEAHFPRETEGYDQFHFSLLPELEGLWQPVFREAEPGSPRNDNRKMDQILAIGSQRGVKKDFFSAVMGQLEKLGTKPSGLTRSGRLDFRYLLANAMQVFTAKPLTLQTSDNPFTNPYLLATLLIPHLETYLALHSEVRYLLLEYPPEHLSTILAMQKLVGVDLMKIAQIIDGNSKEPLPFTHIRGASVGNCSDTSLPSQSKFGALSSTPSSDLKLSKSNFLLTSTASENEIATFISTVWKGLAEVSKFYFPEEPRWKQSSTQRTVSLQSKFTPFQKYALGSQGPLSPIGPAPVGPPPHYPGSPGPSSRAASLAETVKTRKSSKSKHSRALSRTSRFRPPNGDCASFVTFDPAEDSDYDMEARRLMPVYMQKPRRRKGDSRKALKFLGLA